MPQLLSTRNVLLSARPLTVGVIAEAADLPIWVAMPPSEQERTCDLIELRLDTLKLSPEDIRVALSQNTLPVILTARHPAEGGHAPEDAASRMSMLEPLLDLAELVDVELRSAMDMRTLVQKAHATGARVLGSFHDFQATPGEEVLRGALNFAQPAGLDAVKIATYINNVDDLNRLMSLTAEPHRLRLSCMGMGPWGRVSRLALAKSGSLLNYGCIGKANAAGQWPAARLKELLAEI